MDASALDNPLFSCAFSRATGPLQIFLEFVRLSSTSYAHVFSQCLCMRSLFDGFGWTFNRPLLCYALPMVVICQCLYGFLRAKVDLQQATVSLSMAGPSTGPAVLISVLPDLPINSSSFPLSVEIPPYPNRSPSVIVYTI